MLRPVAPGPDTAQHCPASGREQHSHKITVSLSAGELPDLERARLILRRLGIFTDPGRLVREPVAVLLADLDARGQDSVLARRIGAAHLDAGPAAGNPAKGGTAKDGTAGGDTAPRREG